MSIEHEVLNYICSRGSVTIHELVEKFVSGRVTVYTLYNVLRRLARRGRIRRPLAGIYMCCDSSSEVRGVVVQVMRVLDDVLRSYVENARSQTYSFSISIICRKIEKRGILKCSPGLRSDLRKLLIQFSHEHPDCIEVIRRKNDTVVRLRRECVEELRSFLKKRLLNS